MNTNQFEHFVAQYTPALSLRWITTVDGLRMQWTPAPAALADNLLPFSIAGETHSQPAAARNDGHQTMAFSDRRPITPAGKRVDPHLQG